MNQCANLAYLLQPMEKLAVLRMVPDQDRGEQSTGSYGHVDISPGISWSGM
jgi:hypothetical protein